MKKILSVLLAAALILSLLAACGNSDPAADRTDPPADPTQTQTPSGSDGEQNPPDGGDEEDEENYDTGDASLDDPRNADGIGENELMAVSFGTSFNDNRRLTIGAIETAIEGAFPDWSIRRGFTSQIIIDHVLRRDGEVIDNVGEALDRAGANGVKTLVIQPTHLMNGFEYNDVVDEVAQYADAFEAVAIGEPLLTSDEDFAAVAATIVEATAEYDDGNTAMGIIREELAARGVTLVPENEAVMLRVIHTTADFDYTETMTFTADAVKQGVAALKTGTDIVTDTNMAKTGISKSSLTKLGGTVHCYMAEEAVAAMAKTAGTTRAAASIRIAAQAHPGAVFAVGNAPTALLELCTLMDQGPLACRWAL